MQKQNVAALNRSNYAPAANEKHLVHYKAELRRFNSKTGTQESRPEIVKTGVKMFPVVKRDLEKQGYVIEILWHPEGKYNTPLQTAPADPRDAEIAALKAELAKKEEEMKALADNAQEEVAKAAEAAEDKAPAEAPAAEAPAKEKPKAAAKSAKKK